MNDIMNDTGGLNNVPEEGLNEPAFFAIRIISAIFSAVGILVNMALVTTSILDPLKCLRSTTGIFIFNLSLSNLLCSLTVFIASAWGQSIPDIFTLVSQCFAGTSCTFAVVLSVDRLFLVAYPVWYNQTVNNVKQLLVNIAVWVISVSLIISYHYTYLNLGNDWRAHFMAALTGVKLLLFVSIDIATLRKLKRLQENFKQQMKTSGVVQTSAELKRLQTERRFFIVVVVMFVNFLFFILPITTFYHIRIAFQRDMDVSIVSDDSFITILFLLFSLHSLVDPVSYFAAIQKYRKSFLAMKYPALVMKGLTTFLMSCAEVNHRQ